MEPEGPSWTPQEMLTCEISGVHAVNKEMKVEANEITAFLLLWSPHFHILTASSDAELHVQRGAAAGRPLHAHKEGREEKAGSVASNYPRLIGGSVHGLGQGRTGNMRPGLVARATCCRSSGDCLHRAKHTDEIKADTH